MNPKVTKSSTKLDLNREMTGGSMSGRFSNTNQSTGLFSTRRGNTQTNSQKKINKISRKYQNQIYMGLGSNNLSLEKQNNAKPHKPETPPKSQTPIPLKKEGRTKIERDSKFVFKRVREKERFGNKSGRVEEGMKTRAGSSKTVYNTIGYNTREYPRRGTEGIVSQGTPQMDTNTNSNEETTKPENSSLNCNSTRTIRDNSTPNNSIIPTKPPNLTLLPPNNTTNPNPKTQTMNTAPTSPHLPKSISGIMTANGLRMNLSPRGLGKGGLPLPPSSSGYHSTIFLKSAECGGGKKSIKHREDESGEMRKLSYTLQKREEKIELLELEMEERDRTIHRLEYNLHNLLEEFTEFKAYATSRNSEDLLSRAWTSSHPESQIDRDRNTGGVGITTVTTVSTELNRESGDLNTRDLLEGNYINNKQNTEHINKQMEKLRKKTKSHMGFSSKVERMEGGGPSPLEPMQTDNGSKGKLLQTIEREYSSGIEKKEFLPNTYNTQQTPGHRKPPKTNTNLGGLKKNLSTATLKIQTGHPIIHSHGLEFHPQPPKSTKGEGFKRFFGPRTPSGTYNNTLSKNHSHVKSEAKIDLDLVGVCNSKLIPTKRQSTPITVLENMEKQSKHCKHCRQNKGCKQCKECKEYKQYKVHNKLERPVTACSISNLKNIKKKGIRGFLNQQALNIVSSQPMSPKYTGRILLGDPPEQPPLLTERVFQYTANPNNIYIQEEELLSPKHNNKLSIEGEMNTSMEVNSPTKHILPEKITATEENSNKQPPDKCLGEELGKMKNKLSLVLRRLYHQYIQVKKENELLKKQRLGV